MKHPTNIQLEATEAVALSFIIIFLIAMGMLFIII